jgi:TM2 domain-containing membrane protein YozV
MQDVVYLKDGSVIRGTIIEFSPDHYVKIQTGEGNIFAFQMEKVEKITKELLYAEDRKSPGTAIAFSLVFGGFLPIQGTGQWYNGEVGKGLGFFAAGIVGLGLVIHGASATTTYNSYGYYNYEVSDPNEGEIRAGALLYLVSYAISAVDAYRSAKRINRERGYVRAHSPRIFLTFNENEGVGLRTAWSF